MPLPPSAIDQFRHDAPHTPAWSGRLFMFSLTVCLVSIGVFFGLQFGYKPFLESQVADLDQAMKKFTQEIPVESQNQIVRFYSQITNLRGLLNNRPQGARLLEFIEANTLPNIYYERMEFTSKSRGLTLAGKARTISDASAQIALFQGYPGIDRVEVKRVAADTSNLWGFEVVLTLSPAFLSQAPAEAPAPTAPAASSSATSSSASSTAP